MSLEDQNPYFSNIVHPYQKHDEVPLISSFCACYTIEVGIQLIALSDMIMAMVWFTLFFKSISIGMWPFYIFYFILTCGRIGYYVKFAQDDTQMTRRNNYFAQISSSACFMFLYCIHMLTYWIKFDKFPVGFLLWLIFSAFNVIYEILVVRQHYMNYDIDLMKSKLVVDTGEILT